ncbi:MAG: hypothetical protein JXA30_17315 [Deltaproteobacteria bacterium]|nr:hypothetical protein [Deltaproteobacteria bacterium]
MRIIKRFVLTVALMLGCMASFGLPSTQAQDVEISGPLAGAPAVMHLRVYREGRFQVKPAVAMTLQDEFDRAILFGGELNYNIFDFLGVGVWGAYAGIHITTGLTDEVEDKGLSNDRNILSLPDRRLFDDQIGEIQWIAAPQAVFTPLRGKLGIFEELFVDTDFFVFAGVAIVGVEERADVNKIPTCDELTEVCRQSQRERTSRVAIAPTFGVGLSLYFAEFMAMTIEWRGLPFAWNTSGTDESGDPRGDFPDDQIDSDDHLFKFNHLVSLGFAFYLPLDATISHTEN